MSPNVGNFVHDLVEMAKAMETLPQVQNNLAEAKGTIDNLHQAVQDRELSILSYKQQIEDLLTKVRSLEVERDDASFRVLEAEDLAASIKTLVGSAAFDLEVIIKKLNPPKPQPEPETLQPQAVPTRDQIELDPIGDIIVGSREGQLQMPPDWKQDQAETSRLPQDQSASDLTSSYISQEATKSVEMEAGSSKASPEAGSVNQFTEEAPNSANPSPATMTQTGSEQSSEVSKGPYSGKRYYDAPYYISRADWLAGGGTEENYYWRPEYQASL